MARSSIVYWDTCVFLSWLSDEQRKPGEMADLTAHWDEVQKEQLTLITSVITRTEIRQSNISPQDIDRFNGLFGRVNVKVADVTDRIADLTGELRQYYADLSKKDHRPLLSLGDALHLATGLHHRATQIFTFDEKDSKKGRGLITLK